MKNEGGLQGTALKFLAAVVLVAVLSVPLTIALWFARIDVPLLLGYIFPFFYAVTSEGTSAIPTSMAGIATLVECIGVVVAYSIWLRRVRAEKNTLKGALIVVLMMAFANFLWMGVLGLSVMRTHFHIST